MWNLFSSKFHVDLLLQIILKFWAKLIKHLRVYENISVSAEKSIVFVVNLNNKFI